jgi:hypothetical protein
MSLRYIIIYIINFDCLAPEGTSIVLIVLPVELAVNATVILEIDDTLVANFIGPNVSTPGIYFVYTII